MRRTLLTFLLSALFLTGCSANTSSDSASGPKAAVGGRQSVAEPASLNVVRRSVVRTATLDVSVGDTTKAADTTVALVHAVHGIVDADTRSHDGDGHATLVLRVPPASVDEVMADVARLGRETDRHLEQKDVTDQSIDLASRLLTQRASVARVRALLARAQSLSEITGVEAELTKREADLASLQNRSDALAGQVALATVTVQLTGRSKPDSSTSPGFLDGLDGGWSALSGLARGLAILSGAVVPFSPILLLGAALRVLWVRRRASDTKAAPTP